ncbi:hypothetical protein MVEN_02358000 [Mycena venus]|uniref:F-box domain-containing protein n=1 Tax=Mycena venus TaxID=2733690 RepID=A0A8H6X2W9_9AGAR|nr:hypothetical protein MVEN_02358000 [Mycena venus]
MHLALGIPEIVEIICAQLASPLLNSLRRRDFAALARTCKAFHNPALDVLWRKQDTLTRLLKCLPSHLWEEVMRLIKAPLPEDWEKISAYSRRIRELSLTESWSGGFPSSNVLETLASLPRSLCPNLRSLNWAPKTESFFPYILLFLGPEVTHAYIDVPPIASHISLLPTLLRYPELKTFRLGSNSNDTSVLLPASSAIALELSKIESLSLDTLDRPALEHLSRLPSLQILNLRIPEERDLGPQSPSAAIIPRHSQPFTFPALRNVQFFASTIEFATEFAQMLSGCHLEKFMMGTDVLASNVTMGLLYSALSMHVSPTTLHSLWISDVDDGISITPTPPVAPAGFDIDDTTAWDMARAWPKIQSLELGTSTELLHSTRMTLHGYRAFAKHCENLHNLKLAVDASTVPPFDRSPDTRISQHRLRTIDVLKSPISDPRAVARFMSGLFPRLADISTLNDWRWDDLIETEDDAEIEEARALHTRWKQVEALVPMIASIREEERHWAAMANE